MQQELVDDLKATVTIIIKMTICKTLRHCGLKSYSANKVPQLNVQDRLKFVNNHLDDSENA